MLVLESVKNPFQVVIPGWQGVIQLPGWTTWRIIRKPLTNTIHGTGILVGGWTNTFERYYSSQIGSFPPRVRGENKKYLSCHHPDFLARNRDPPVMVLVVDVQAPTSSLHRFWVTWTSNTKICVPPSVFNWKQVMDIQKKTCIIWYHQYSQISF